MHDTDIDRDLRAMIDAAMSAAGTPDDVRERVLEREQARIRDNLELAASWSDLEDQDSAGTDMTSVRSNPQAEVEPPADTLATAIQEAQDAVTDVHFEALVLGQFKAMETLWRAAPVSFHSASVQTEFALNLEHLVTALEQT